MGCGQSGTKRAQTTPIISRAQKLEQEKDHGNQWNTSKEDTGK